jgi:selenocysteine-specific elongation factor
MRVIGTAGHVDHGKSELVLALTGIDPDRLKEEQEREMTIDLGFAWMDLPNGERVGIVDVPGHRDFIENMLAGVGGIDAALFVVAADEGVMPQTREHLGILDLLGISKGVVALTKVDLVKDPEWLELVREDVQTLLLETSLAQCPIVPVSAKTGFGLQELRIELQEELAQIPPVRDVGRARLPVDRAFTISGFGTIVTGTLQGGHFEIGDEVVVLPDGLRGRIRGLQSHNAAVQRAAPGTRVAMNLASIDVQDVARGDVVVAPGTFVSTRRIDVSYQALPDAGAPLRHDMRVKLFVGASQVMARVRLLGKPAVEPGGEGWLQLEMRHPIVTERGDRFILRRPSPPATLGGGQVADPHPKRRYRLQDESAIERLRKLVSGSPEDILLEKFNQLGVSTLSAAVDAAGLTAIQGQSAAQTLRESGDLMPLAEGGGETAYATKTVWRRMRAEAEKALNSYHERFPLRVGMPTEELKSRMGVESRVFQGVLGHLKEASVVEELLGRIRLAGFRVAISDDQQKRIDDLLAQFGAEPHAPPSYKQAIATVGDELLGYLIQSGQLIQVSPDVLFSAAVYERMVSDIRGMIRQHGSVTVGEVRDHYSTSRKYVLALLEHLDEIGVTEREGDQRKLKAGSAS